MTGTRSRSKVNQRDLDVKRVVGVISGIAPLISSKSSAKLFVFVLPILAIALAGFVSDARADSIRTISAEPFNNLTDILPMSGSQPFEGAMTELGTSPPMRQNNYLSVPSILAGRGSSTASPFSEGSARRVHSVRSNGVHFYQHKHHHRGPGVNTPTVAAIATPDCGYSLLLMVGGIAALALFRVALLRNRLAINK